MFQIAKIINFYGGNDKNQIFLDNDNHIQIKQTTSVCSYFIIKTFILLSYDKFLDFWKRTGFALVRANRDEYVELYKNMLEFAKSRSENMHNDDVNKFIEDLDSIDKNSFIYKTMRMTCLELY